MRRQQQKKGERERDTTAKNILPKRKRLVVYVVVVVVILVYRRLQIPLSNYTMDPSSSTVFQGDNRIGFTAPSRPPYRRFDNASIHMTKALASLGPNVLTVYSGCRMARWVYPFRPHSNLKYNHWKYDDCNAFNNPNKVLRNISQLSENDTIYVLHIQLNHFVKQLKDEELSVDIVVVSGGWSLVKPNV